MPATTVVVVTWRGAAHLGDCLDGLAAQTRPHRILVVDNAADVDTRRILAEHPSAPDVLRLERNTGYAGGIAAALDDVDTEFVAWLNDDAVPSPSWLADLEAAAGPATAAVTSRLLRPDGTVQSTGVELTADGHGRDLAEPAATSPGATPAPFTPSPAPFGFCGGAALVRTRALRDVGGVPAEFFCYYEDTDTSWRLRLAGWDVAAAATDVHHRHGASTRPGSAAFHRWNERNRLLMLLRCAPAGVALRELARFTVLTAVLPLRTLAARRRPGVRPGPAVPDAANFDPRLRLRVLADVTRRTPWTRRTRRDITRRSTVGRGSLWRHWTGG
ncbi:glycosyltransferase family 2 protein [Prauserella halophila]|uniref:glycosyltransferase family 2 protein n=1 Tax=Prauserella halophila TaxID=185641 RepID=UPI0020A4631B|nr:glycosyltransferase family 2 protein [Prauserella halophila]